MFIFDCLILTDDQVKVALRWSSLAECLPPTVIYVLIS